MPILTLDQKLDIRKKRRMIRDHQRKQKKLQSIYGEYLSLKGVGLNKKKTPYQDPRQTSFLDLPGAFSDSQDDDHIHQVKEKQGPFKPGFGCVVDESNPRHNCNGVCMTKEVTSWVYVCRCGATKNVNHCDQRPSNPNKEHGKWMVSQ